MATKYIIVSCWGDLFRLTERGYARWLRDHALGLDPSLTSRAYGGKCIGHATDVTDITHEQSRQTITNTDFQPSRTGLHTLLSQKDLTRLANAKYDDRGWLVKET